MILVCGKSTDPITRFFCNRLERIQADYRLLDLNRYPNGYKVIHRRRADRSVGSISFGDWSLQTDDVSGVFVRNRYNPDKQIGDPHGEEVGVALDAELNLGLDGIFAGLECPVVNPFNGSWSNQSKPFQSMLIRSLGFEVPATLITNDLSEARRFYEEMKGDVIYKSASAMTKGTHQLELKDLSKLIIDRRAPIQFQERVRGTDIRVHVVRDQVFPTKVHSDLVDYRFERTEQLRMEAVVLPDEVAKLCTHLTQKLGLLFAGIDLRETPDGRFYCFEVNTQPGFAFYEQRTEQPITRALLRLLNGKPSEIF